MHSRKSILALYKSLSPKTVIPAKGIQENPVVITGYQPARVKEFRRW
jgi:hypothetical protein